jgi:uncharacterized protein YbjT (DUF2867 family)
MQKRVLVVGANGLLGRPVAEQLQRDGFVVRALVRDVKTAPPGVEVVCGQFEDEHALDRALEGCNFVHVTIRPDAADAERVEAGGMAALLTRARQHHIERVSYVSGMFVDVLPIDHGPEHRAKVLAERQLRASELPYTIFRPTFFLENLPKHLQGPFAIVFGRQRHPLRMVAAGDFARQVSRALIIPAASGKIFPVMGPEPIRVHEAVRRYMLLRGLHKPIVTVPFALARAADAVFNGGRFGPTLRIMSALNEYGDCGDSAEADNLLGANSTTLEGLFGGQSAHEALAAARA